MKEHKMMMPPPESSFTDTTAPSVLLIQLLCQFYDVCDNHSTSIWKLKLILKVFVLNFSILVELFEFCLI